MRRWARLGILAPRCCVAVPALRPPSLAPARDAFLPDKLARNEGVRFLYLLNLEKSHGS